MSGKADSRKTIFFALGANFAIFVAKLAAAITTGSGAMMAEAVHSLADCGNQGLLLLGMRSAKAPATSEHPLGQGKAIYFWSFLVALMLFSVGGAFSIYEGLHKLSHPEPLRLAGIAIGVLLIVVAVFIAIEVKALLIGQSADLALRGEIRALIESRPEVVRVFNLITLQLGPDVMVSVKAEMRHDASALDIVDAINSVEHAMKERFPEIRWSFFEPDVSD
jgi:divalent metal cation (Fe/Co/Zn/Cd) transporter